MKRLGVDTGGTFTDFVLLDAAGELRVHKVLSTPHAPEQAILQGIGDMGLEGVPLQLVHGSTVATNAVLEGKGVKTLYVANTGFADLLKIGRQQRAALYDLQPALPRIVPGELSIEIDCRLDANGEIVEPLTQETLDAFAAAIRLLRPEAVAVNLLFSYLDPESERRIAAVVPDEVFVSLSSSVLPEIREYERGMATWLNAWIGPKVAGYLSRLRRALGEMPVSVMQSSGDTVAADQAAEQAVRMLLSGPAGGLAAARFVGQQAGFERLLTFDMGGTSTDVALVDAEPRLTTEGRIAAFPVAVPMVDMHTIGAGGGSIAWVDAGGMLQVGPQSAGADPGPACYGRGGREPAVTDANLILGHIQADAFLGGDMSLDVAAAEQAMSRLAAAMGVDTVHAANDIVAVANEHMAQALRAILIKRGVDPHDYTLMSFGGAGGLHVCALADLLDMASAIVPVHGGVFSALGMLAARPGRQFSQTYVGLLAQVPVDSIEAAFEQLREQGRAALHEEGFSEAQLDASASVDVRYAGQSYTLNLPWQPVSELINAFHCRHRERYGHDLDLPVELVNLRLAVRGPESRLSLPPWPERAAAEPFGQCRVEGVGLTPQYWRDQLAAGQCIDGPALIFETVATTWVAPGWRLRVDAVGNLLLSL
ncbi:hydantoinase/oxoprolinase family protein [Thiosocius teredinicola]|uniref:hydantoinase/oxoprolinase family protein n=1 Tax=Thiosocius teredinicola TaxID=1973002 RepID=UPI000990F042